MLFFQIVSSNFSPSDKPKNNNSHATTTIPDRSINYPTYTSALPRKPIPTKLYLNLMNNGTTINKRRGMKRNMSFLEENLDIFLCHPSKELSMKVEAI